MKYDHFGFGVSWGLAARDKEGVRDSQGVRVREERGRNLRNPNFGFRISGFLSGIKKINFQVVGFRVAGFQPGVSGF